MIFTLEMNLQTMEWMPGDLALTTGPLEIFLIDNLYIQIANVCAIYEFL